MPRIVEYMVVEHMKNMEEMLPKDWEGDIQPFQKKVNAWIKMNWELFGRPFIAGSTIYQAMVKYEE